MNSDDDIYAQVRFHWKEIGEPYKIHGVLCTPAIFANDKGSTWSVFIRVDWHFEPGETLDCLITLLIKNHNRKVLVVGNTLELAYGSFKVADGEIITVRSTESQTLMDLFPHIRQPTG